MTNPSPFWKRAAAGACAGLLAGLAMTATMLLLAQIFGVATPLTLVGDRLSVFFNVEQFLAIMGRVGGYNHMKQLGVSSVIAGQLIVGALGGVFYGALAPRGRLFSVAVFIVFPLVAVAAVLWPVLGTHYGGLPIRNATILTLLGLLISFIAFERTLVLGFAGLFSRPRSIPPTLEYTPPIGRRALIIGGLGLLVAGGSAGLLRKLYRAATFSYDGQQYGGTNVQAITPNDQFYCVTKNVIDPIVSEKYWRLDVTGLVQKRQRYKIERLKGLKSVTQETTLMCISNGIGAGLISNAQWTGVPMRTLLEAAGPLPSARKVKLHGVDNYTDTITLEKALDPATLIAFAMNGEPLPQRHGFPARAVVPGYFGEKHVKWITRIELADESAVGFYEKQGWGPEFTVPIRSRIDQPYAEEWFSLGQLGAEPVVVKGIAFGGDRGVSRVEVSADDGATWADAKLDYPGTLLTWALWSHEWRPPQAGDHLLVVRATNRDGLVQTLNPDRPAKSGVTGFHKVPVHVSA